jgi:4-diphosphocytidyl-2C-methyl-D-erythritol kinase
VTAQAKNRAKLNLALHLRRRRADSYHESETEQHQIRR